MTTRAEIEAMRLWQDPTIEEITAALLSFRRDALEEAARLHEQINPASDDERRRGDPGAGAMRAVIEYRDAIRKLAEDAA